MNVSVDVGPPPSAVIMQMLTGAYVTKLVAEIARLGIADVLKAHGPLSTAEMAHRRYVATNPSALQRALRACAALGIFSEDSSGRFGPTPLSDVLTVDAPGSLKHLAQFQGGLLWRVWTGLDEGLRTGQPQARAQLGADFFEHLTNNPDAMQEFGEAMKGYSFQVSSALLEHYGFDDIRKIVDVGGGFGHLVLAMLERYPELRGVVFDLPDVIALAPHRRPVTDPAIAARVEYVTGDMFSDVPPADAYVLKMIIHDWDDAGCVRLLRNCCKRLEPGGRVLCVDAVLPPMGDTSDTAGKLLDVNMMLVLPGKERTLTEWQALYDEAGLKMEHVIPIPDTFGTCVLEGRRR